MKKLVLLFPVLAIVFLGIQYFPQSVYAKEGRLTYGIQPSGPLDPGQTYSVKITVLNNRGMSCQQCSFKISFQGGPQPLDYVELNKITTNDEGIAYVNATSYVPTNRDLIIESISTQDQYNTQIIPLFYNNNPFLSVINSIKKVASLGIPFPPMGNVYPTITKQQYIGGITRTIYLKYNQPFGTKLFKISEAENNNGSMQLLRSTKDTEISIEVSALNDVNIGIQACSTSSGDDISCVGPYGLLAPRISNPIEASKSGELQVPNGGSLDFISPEERIKKETEQIDNNPFSRLFKAVYSLYK